MAFGLLGLSPEQFWRTTPAELTAMVESRIKYLEADRGFYDGLNGVLCSTLAGVHGVKDTKPADFMITRREIENIVNVEAIDQKMRAWVAMGGQHGK